MKVCVIGMGHWGTALAHFFAVQGEDVIAWSRNQEVLNEIKANRKNPVIQFQHTVHNGVNVEPDIVRAVSLSDFIVLTVSAKGLSDVLDNIKRSAINDKIVISGIKGIVDQEFKTPTDLISERLGVKPCTISGPSFAEDVINNRPWAAVVAHSDLKVAERVCEKIRSKRMRPYMSDDIRGVELSGVLKNVIAIGAGICDGMDLGESARTAFITRGLAEMIRVIEALGGRRETVYGLAGVGDLFMTASSSKSRNWRLGWYLVKERDLLKARDRVGSTAEGVRTTRAIVAHKKKINCDIPICEAIYKCLETPNNIDTIIDELFRRPIKKEG